MKALRSACTAALLTTAAFAAGPGGNMGSLRSLPAPATVSPMPVSMTSGRSCAEMIAQARLMPAPTDAAKSKTVRDQIVSAAGSSDEATCRAHAQAALDALSDGGT